MPGEEELPRDVRSLCEYLVRRLVDDPGAVRVEEAAEDGQVVLRVFVADEDRGKVIGRQGRVVRALRTVTRAGGVRTGQRVNVEIEA
jgi:uncharacterized protein